MANLLDQASIVLTPTAYKNSRVMCVKPSDASGDFTFSRNSAATRVNAKGLVENVQILSNNLVQNGDFSEEGAEEVTNGSFSQEGVELITNGDFSSDTGWIKGTGWTISGGSLNGSSSTSSTYQNNSLVNGTMYKATYTVSNYVSGSVQIKLGGSLGQARTADGTYTEYLTASQVITWIVGNNFTGSIDNVSVREVGQDWVFSSGAYLTDIGAKITHAPTLGQIQQSSVLVVGKQYKFTYEITESIAGSLKLNSAGDNTMDTSVGVHTKYFEATQGTLAIARTNGGNNDVTITNISVKEVGQNWALIGTATITENQANIVTASAVTGISQTNILTIGESYKLTYNIVSNNNGGLKISGNEIPSVVGNNTYYFTASATALEILRNSGVTDISITNISVIEITDDTNLPRINYEGFSYQDALGSEEVVNGTFATDSDWTKGTGWSINGGNATSDGSASNLDQSGTFLSGKTYKVVYDVLNYVSGDIRFRFTGTSNENGTLRNTNGTYTEYIKLANNQSVLRFPSSSFNGSIDNVSVKEYLGQEVVPDSGCGSWLFEPASTNLVPYSEDFSQWIGSGCTVGNSSSVVSPSNSNNIGIITGTIGTGAKFARINVITSSSILTYSAFFKYNSHQWVQFASGATSEYANFDIQNGVVGNKLSGTTSTIDNFGNGWYRCTLSTSVASTPSNMAVVLIDTANSSRLDDTSSVGSAYIWGAQLEQQSYATSYIPTNGEANGVTRNQDVCTNGGSLASINSTEGTLYAEIAALANENLQRILSVSDGTHNNTVKLGFANNTTDYRFFVDIRVGGVNQAFLTYNFGAVAPTFKKCAIKYKENDFALWIDGVEVATDTSGNTPIGLNELSFTRGDTAQNFFGKTKALAVWKEALSDEELTELTTI